MVDKATAEKIARGFYRAIDARDWNLFESDMTDEVNITMKSPEREKSSVMTKDQIMAMWRDWFALPYDKTLHVIKNLEVFLTDDKAEVKVDIDSTHFLGDEKWTGVGTYIFVIKEVDGKARITDLNYTLEIITGDVALRTRMLALRK